MSRAIEQPGQDHIDAAIAVFEKLQAKGAFKHVRLKDLKLVRADFDHY